MSYEEAQWQMPNDGMVSRRKRREGSGRYRLAITPQIAAAHVSLSSALAADVEDATAELARFDTYTATRFVRQTSTLGPMSAVLLRTESSSSSQIEQITVGVRQLALAELHESQSVNAGTVVGNVRAMNAALELAGGLDLSAILAMHHALLTRQPGWEMHAGQLRRQVVWVGGYSPVVADYVAPHHDRVPGAIADLVAFMARDDIPVVAQAAISHAQFESIHPFVDGNGRTGRALVHALLRAKQATVSTTAPLSAGLLRHQDGYFDALTAYRNGDIAPIIERFADAGRFAARSGMALVDELAIHVERAKEALAGLRPQALAWQVLPQLVAQPVVNSSYLVDELGFNQMAAQRTLATLVERGVLDETTGGARNRVWIHRGIVQSLEEFASNLRRN